MGILVSLDIQTPANKIFWTLQIYLKTPKLRRYLDLFFELTDPTNPAGSTIGFGILGSKTRQTCWMRSFFCFTRRIYNKTHSWLATLPETKTASQNPAKHGKGPQNETNHLSQPLTFSGAFAVSFSLFFCCGSATEVLQCHPFWGDQS